MNIKISILMISLGLILAGLFMHKTKKTNQPAGIVILLNGASASGKSSLQKELQKLFSTPYLAIGLDNFFVGVLPERFVTGPRLEGDVDHELVMKGIPNHDTDGNKLFHLIVGPIGDNVMHGMHHAIAAYAHQGNNCIVDYIAYKKEWVADLHAALEGITVYTVGVDCPLETLEQREKARGRSFVEGHARSHYQTVHEAFDNTYDIRINTGQMSSAECAQKIYAFIQANKRS